MSFPDVVRNGGCNIKKGINSMGLKKLLLGALLTAGFCVTAAEPLSVKMSNLGLEILSKDLGNISMGSRIVAVEPPWVQLRFYSVWAQLNCINQGNTAEMKQAIDTEAFKIINYSAVADGNTVTVKFSGELREDVPTAVEYSMFAVPAFLLAGSSYTVTYYDGAKSSGTIPQIGENTTNAFIKRAQKVEFEGTYGKLTVESVKGPLFDVVDRRLYTFEGESVFWFGKLVDEKEPLKFGEVYDSELKFTFEPTGNTIFAPELANINDGLPMEQVEDENFYEEYEFDLPTYMPQPKEMVVYGIMDEAKSFKVGKFSEDVSEEDRGYLSKAINSIDDAGEDGARPVNITLVLDDPAMPESEEGYILTVTADIASIRAKTPRGAFYAIQTLKAMPQDEMYVVRDWPDLGLRSVHLLAAEETPTFHKWMVENIFSRYKLNKIILEVEYAQWDTTKNLHQPRTATKDGLREFVQVCRENYIEVIPLFQTLGHLEWFFYKGQNLEMAEDPNVPYAYNPMHPGVYPIMDAILEEIIEIFDSEYIHIGHDEVDMIGRFPNRPENVERGIANVVYDDIMHYYDWAKAHGKKLMMWHDMMLSNQECPNGSGMHIDNVKEAFRDRLPRDIVIADWQYSGNKAHAEYKDVKLLMDEGFDVIGCTWYETDNVENFTKAVKKYGALGMMGTTWTGYFSGWNSFDEHFHQMATYPRVGAWAWTVTDDNYAFGNYHEVLADILMKKAPWSEEDDDTASEGRLINLNKVTNIALPENCNVFLANTDFGLPSALTPGKVMRAGSADFLIPERDGELAVIGIKSRQNANLPDSVSIKLDTKAEKLYLLHSHIGPSVPNFDQEIARLKLVYADGTSEELPLIFGRNIGSFKGEASKNLTRANVLVTPEGRIWYTVWDNPHPDKEIASLDIISSIMPYYLFGLSLQ